MTSPESDSNDHPIWEGAIIGLIGAVQLGLLHPSEIIPRTYAVVAELLEQGMITDYGQLQTWMRKQELPIQLVSQPFDISRMPDNSYRCLDPQTHEPLSRYLTVSVGYTDGDLEANHLLQSYNMSHEQNEYALAHDTGVLCVD